MLEPRESATAFIAAKSYKEKNNIFMKITKLAALIVTVAVALFILIPNLSWAANDGAGLYKAKCAVCHGADGAGKPAAKIPALKSDDVKKKSDEELTKFVQTNAKHAGAAKALNEEQLKAVINYVRELNK